MLNKQKNPLIHKCVRVLPTIPTFLTEEDVLISPTEGDPGLISGCGHQLRPDLHQRVLQPVQLQLPHQRAEQHGCHGVGEPSTEHKQNVRTAAGRRGGRDEATLT